MNEKAVNINQLVESVRERYPGQEAVYIRADKEVIYEPLAQVISKLGEGKLNVRLVTQPIENSPRRGR